MSSSSYTYDSSSESSRLRRRRSSSSPEGRRSSSSQNVTFTLTVTPGEYRELTDEDKKRIGHKNEGRESFCCGCLDRGYKYVITAPFTARVRGGMFGASKAVTVPAGFLCDGSTGGPDRGNSWVFHDWLYATHEWDGGDECTRQQADELMYRVLKQEGEGFYAWGFKTLAGCDCLGLFGKAWESSGSKGRKEYMMSRR